MSPDDKLFNLALQSRNQEIALFWQRSNYFLVLNSALAVGFFSLEDQSYAVPLAVLGIVAASLWLLVNLGGKYWQSRWEYELSVREKRLFPQDSLFSATREETDEYVRASLAYHKHSVIHRAVDWLVLLKPSVSLMMTFLSIVFVIAWGVLLGMGALRGG